MNYQKTVTIEVNGKLVQATVTVEAPGLSVENDCVNAEMILSAIGSGRDTTHHSRHHKDRKATIRMSPPVENVTVLPLRRVA